MKESLIYVYRFLYKIYFVLILWLFWAARTHEYIYEYYLLIEIERERIEKKRDDDMMMSVRGGDTNIQCKRRRPHHIVVNFMLYRAVCVYIIKKYY